MTGALASVLVGGGLGLLGSVVMTRGTTRPALVVAMTVTAVAIARETHLVRLPLPQARRQTRRIWALLHSPTTAAALWGLDIGAVFTTWFTFAGVWALVAVAIISANVEFGAGLIVVYWAGRALALWLTPLIIRDANSTPALLSVLAARRDQFRWVHVGGLAWLLAMLSLWTIRSGSMMP
jgi:hypothetical protein